MQVKRKPSETTGDSLLSIIAFRYLPFWPLFLLLALAFLSVALVYTKYITPTYKIGATLVINDKLKGAEESQTLQSLNLYAGNKTVENEVMVLQSRTLMRDVVLNLKLYAPVYEKGRIKPAPAYLTSPVLIEVRNPDTLKEHEEIGIEYNKAAQQVTIAGKSYPLNQWVNLPEGTMRFSKNPAQIRTSYRALYFSLIDPKLVTDGLLKNLEVGASSKLSSVVNVQYTDEIPERGEDIVNALLDSYTRASILNSNQLAANTLIFVSDRLNLLEGELDSINRRIQQFKSTAGVVDLSEQGKLYLQSVSDNDRKASDLSMQLAVLNQVEQHVQSGQNKSGIVPTTLGIDDLVLTDLLQKLNNLELQYSNLRTTTGENNPITEAVKSEIDKIRPNILSIVRNQRARLQASRNNLNNTTGRFNNLINGIPQKEKELVEISRQQAIKNDVYAFLLQKKEEAELSSASTISDSRIVDRAEAGVKPVASKKLLVLAGALIAAIAFSIGYVFYKEGLTDKILFRQQIERGTAFPVIAEITHLKHKKTDKPHLLSDPALTAQFRQLQVALGLFNGQKTTRKILISSSLENEGKTLISNQLVQSLASAGQKALLIDLNFYVAETSGLHQLSSKPGWCCTS